MSCDAVCRHINFLYFIIVIITIDGTTVDAYYNARDFECGPYGFVCEGRSKLRLCGGEDLVGPSFLCPAGTMCNEDSNDVCEDMINYIDPAMRTIRCRRNERIADPSVPGCKGYILCIPNKNRFQGIKFKCTGKTIFNGYTGTCSAPETYRCPLTNTTKTGLDLFEGNKRKTPSRDDPRYPSFGVSSKPRPIDCKNYKFSVTQDTSPVRATYFCPPRPEMSGIPTRCTVFSNNFCLLLERDDEDQFIQKSGAAYRRPRKLEDTKS